MRRRHANLCLAELPRLLGQRLRPPFVVILGGVRQAADLVAALGAEVTCYQMDLYPAERLQGELAARGLTAQVTPAADLWDLPAHFETAIYPVEAGGERALKLDLVEQAYHVLRPGGRLVVLSPYVHDQLFPELLRKVFGRFHTVATAGGQILWAVREGERRRRRHEIAFSAGRLAPELQFLSRPGVFAYGRFDEGALALVETATVFPGAHILDLGCGCGVVGALVGRRAGPEGLTVFVDSNLRAVALAEHNARSAGLARFQTVASAHLEGIHGPFDLVLANPPYFAYEDIAGLFVRRGRELLRPGGRFYLVTKHTRQMQPLLAEHFGTVQEVRRRGYSVLWAEAAS